MPSADRLPPRQEWKERRTYKPDESTLKKCLFAQEEQQVKEQVSIAKPILFVQDNCPNCKMAELMLGKAGVDVDEVNAMQNAELSKKFAVKLTPTLVVADGDSYKVYENASNVRKYIESVK